MKKYILAGMLLVSIPCFSQKRVDTTTPPHKYQDPTLGWIVTHYPWQGGIDWSSFIISLNHLQDSLRKDSLRRAKYAPYHKQT